MEMLMRIGKRQRVKSYRFSLYIVKKHQDKINYTLYKFISNIWKVLNYNYR